MGEIFSFLEICFTSWPLSVAILVIIIAVFLIWFFKLRPQEKEEAAKREEINRKREDDFLQAMTECKENFRHTAVMYDRALENSTKALENSTEAMNIMSLEMKHLSSNVKDHDEQLEKVKNQTQRASENMVKIITLLENRD